MIELHDSEIASIEFDADAAIITFSHAYIHKSDGVPGVDSGTGWSQRAELKIKNVIKPEAPKHLPYRIDDGVLKLDHAEYPNEIPIPLSYDGTVTLNLWVANAEESYNGISIAGKGAELKLIGDAEYIEDFLGQRTDSSADGAT